MAASLYLGLHAISPVQVWNALVGDDSISSIVFTDLRLPRTLIGAVAGAWLALSGRFMQAATHNPVAELGLLGVNAGAAFVVTIGAAAFIPSPRKQNSVDFRSAGPRLQREVASSRLAPNLRYLVRLRQVTACAEQRPRFACFSSHRTPIVISAATVGQLSLD